MIDRPTLKNVASEAGVSAMTVSLALRNSPRISVATRKMVQAMARKMGYQQNSFAASLVSFRTTANPKFQATLALLNCYNSKTEWHRYAAFNNFYLGAMERSKDLGYQLEEFWLNDPNISTQRLRKTFEARGIPGIIMSFLDENRQSVEKLHTFDFTNFATVTLGWRMDDLNIHSASNDQFHTASVATQKLLDLGYRRIGLILNEKTDAALDHRYFAGFLVHQAGLPDSCKVPAYAEETLTRETFLAWVRNNKMDAVLAAPAGVHRWLEEDGFSIPDDIGFAYLDRITPGGELAGIDQNDKRVGSAAVDIIVAQLHRNEYGLPPFQKSLLIQGEWKEGWSVRKMPDSPGKNHQSPPVLTGEKSAKPASPKSTRSRASKVAALAE